MRFVFDALRRFGWLAAAAAALVALVAYFVEARAGVRYAASAAAAGRRAADLLQDRDAVQLGAALVKAHVDVRKDLGPDFWKGASEESLREKLEKAGLVSDPKRWPEVKVVDEPRVPVAVDGERATAEAGDPDLARLAANARAKAAVLVGAARQRHALSRLESLQSRVEFADYDDGKVEEATREMERRMTALQGSANALVVEVEAVRARQDRAKGRIRILEAAEHRLRESLPTGPEENGLTSALFEKLTAERESVRAERALKMAGRTAEDPEVRRLTARMADLELEMRKELYVVREKAILGLRNSIDAMDSELVSLDRRGLDKLLETRELADKIREQGPRRAEKERLLADLAAARKTRDDLGDEAVPLATLAAEAVDVLRSGGVRWKVVWTMTGLGAVAGLLLALLARGSDRRVRTGDDVKRRLGAGVLGLAEDVKGDPLILRAGTDTGPAMDYSLAAGVLRGYMAEREFRVVLVTSAAAGEGKSTAAANLATSLARKGMNVALIDADLRAPRQASIFGLDDSQGLSTILQGGEIQPDLPAGATELATLRVLTSGPIGELPAELLESPRLAELLRALRERYDVVVIDGPPVAVGGDAVTLARMADTVAWVVRAGRLPAGRLGWVKHILKNVGADVAGVILVGSGESAAEREYAYPSVVTK